MGEANQRGEFDWFSTHPSGPHRIEEIERHLPEVMPLYEASQRERSTSG
jgi:predicted Zn-dependent protease